MSNFIDSEAEESEVGKILKVWCLCEKYICWRFVGFKVLYLRNVSLKVLFYKILARRRGGGGGRDWTRQEVQE